MVKNNIVLACLMAGGVLVGAPAARGDEGQAPAPEAKAPEKPAKPARPWGLWIEAVPWMSQPVGADYTPATENNPDDPFDTRGLDVRFGTKPRVRWRLGYSLPKEFGDIVVTYYSVKHDEPFSQFAPGRFIYGETLAYPVFAGFSNDGLADAVTARTDTNLRDLRLDFSRESFRTERISGRWYAGLRSIDHEQRVDARYYALVPNLPPLFDPETGNGRPDLVPQADFGTTKSAFSGRGIEAGLEFAFRFHPKLQLEAGLGAAVLRGWIEASYASRTWVYLLTDSGVTYLVPPDQYDLVFNDPFLVSETTQSSVAIGYHQPPRSATAFILDTNLGVRWTVWRTLEIVGGLRGQRYTDVALEVRPADVTYSPDGPANFQRIERQSKSIGYEGYYLGVAYKY